MTELALTVVRAGERRVRRAQGWVRPIVRLLAVYGPLLFVVLVPNAGPVLARAYLLAGIWAFEAIAWYVLEGRIAPRRKMGARGAPRDSAERRADAQRRGAAP